MKVSIDVIIHATEDIEKFYHTFEEIFQIEPKTFLVQNLSGHYDNPITMLNVKLVKKRADRFVDKMIHTMPQKELDKILQQLDEMISSSGLHLRFDKQRFINGELVLEEKSAIKVKVYTPVYNKKNTITTYQTLLNRIK